MYNGVKFAVPSKITQHTAINAKPLATKVMSTPKSKSKLGPKCNTYFPALPYPLGMQFHQSFTGCHWSPLPLLLMMAALMQLQTMTLPPLCLTVGKTHSSLYYSPGCRHTRLTPSEPNTFILVSSDHRTWFL